MPRVESAVGRWRRRSVPMALGAALVVLVLPAAARGQQPPPSPAWIATDAVEPVPTAALDRVLVVKADALNLRREPSPSSPPLGLLRRGDMLRVLGQRSIPGGDRWLRVRPEGGAGEGWIADGFAEPVRPAVATLAAAARAFGGSAASASSSSPEAPAVATVPVFSAGLAPVEKVRVGFVFSAPVGDAGWTYSHDEGRKALERLPYVAATAYRESVPEQREEVLAAIDGLVAEGANLVFATSFGYMDPTVEAAARHPGVVFMHSAGFRTAANLGTYFAREYEARYLAGMLAGGTTRTNILGYVAAFPIAQVLRGINAFALGALAVNPDAEIRVLWTGTWFGPGVERETAERLMDGGADVLTMHQNSPATVQAAEGRGRRAIGYHSDMGMFGPTAALASVAWDWGPMYEKIARDVHRGAWEPYKLWWGLKDGGIRLTGISRDVPASLRRRVAEAEEAIKAGRLRIFEGTIRDNRGRVRVPSRQVLGDAELLAMDFLVLGVDGEVPTPKAPSGPTD